MARLHALLKHVLSKIQGLFIDFQKLQLKRFHEQSGVFVACLCFFFFSSETLQSGKQFFLFFFLLQLLSHILKKK